MARMTIPDALRIASIFEQDDVISVPAMACRVMAKYIKELEEKLSERAEGEVDPPLQE